MSQTLENYVINLIIVIVCMYMYGQPLINYTA